MIQTKAQFKYLDTTSIAGL